MAEHNKFQQFKKPADQKSAGDVEDRGEPGIRVIVTADGIYDSKRMTPGMEIVVPRRLFSKNWMKIKEQE